MKKLLTCFAAVALAFAACTEFDESAPPPDREAKDDLSSRATSSTFTPNPNDPYALSNVQAAWNIVAAEQGLRPTRLKATHHYVRFLPKDTTDVYILVDSLGLSLIPYPYDQELTDEEVQAYFDESVDNFVWQYCLVEADFPMPVEVESERLTLVYYQPEEDGERDAKRTRQSSTGTEDDRLPPEIYEAVSDKSWEITGRDAPKQTRGGRWYPSAHVSYTDEFGTTMNLGTVRIVVTNRASVPFHGYTSHDGWAHIRKHNGKGFYDDLKFHIEWTTGKWNIKTACGTSVAYAYAPGGRRRSEWICNIAGYHESAMHATLHRALHAYFYDDVPKAAHIWKIRHVNVRARWNKADCDEVGGNFNHARSNEIHVFSRNKSRNFTNHEMFATTLHELGHASHWQAVVDLPGMNRYEHFYSSYICETWAQGVEYAYLSSLYPNNFIGYMYYHAMKDPWHGDSPDDYTAIIESFMNQGITLKQLEGVFMGQRHLWHCVAPTKALKKIPDQIVDMIYSNPLRFDPVRADMAKLITGPKEPKTNESVTYSIPPTTGTRSLPRAIEFTGWTLRSNTVGTESEYEAVDLSSRDLTIKFFTGSGWRLRANFRIPLNNPNGSTDIEEYFCEISIDPQAPPAPFVLQRPHLSYGIVLAPIQPELKGAPLNPGKPIDPIDTEERMQIRVENAQSGVTYEWTSNGNAMSSNLGGAWLVPKYFKGIEPETIRCRAHHGNETTPWSNSVVILWPSGEVIPGAPRISYKKASDTVTFTVEDASDWMSYEWERNGSIIPGENGPTVSVPLTQSSKYASIKMRCRAKDRDGKVSDWSDPVDTGALISTGGGEPT